VVEPNRLIDLYGVDAVRYFLMREVPFGIDGDFSHSSMVHRINGDLANDLGNLFSRSLSMVLRYFNGEIPSPNTSAMAEIDIKLKDTAETAFPEVSHHIDDIAFSKALASIWEIVNAANKYIDETAPWTLAKDKKNRPRLETVLYGTLESLRIIALLLAAFMPFISEKMWSQLKMEGNILEQNLEETTKWGGLIPGNKVEKPIPLFPRIDPSKIPIE